MKSDEDQLREYISDAMLGHVGQKVTPLTVDMVRATIRDTIAKTQGVESVPKVQVKMLWKSMSLREKFKWFLFNRFPFKKEGDAHRATIRAHWNLIHRLEEENIDVPGFYSVYPVTPSYLEPSPKSVVQCNAWIHLAQPVNYIAVDMTIEKDK